LLPSETAENAEHHARVISPLKTKPIRTVLVWQLVATLAMAVIAALWAGGHGAMSALLGGLVNVAAGVVYAFLLGVGLRARPIPEVGASLVAMLRAEAAKILVIVGGLWLALTTYPDLVPGAFFTAFVVTVIVFSMAIFVRE
jgi:ATP synthase protein I